MLSRAQSSYLLNLFNKKRLEASFEGRLVISLHGCIVFQTLWATARLKKFSSKYTDLFNLVENLPNAFSDFPFKYFGWDIAPQQVYWELSSLIRIAIDRKPKVILEIGTATGGTLFVLSRIAPKDATIISIDLPGGKYGEGYPMWRIPYYKSFAAHKQKMILFRGDSHAQSIFEKVKKILGSKQLDLLFVDGDHTYSGVKQDFEIYGPLVKKGGLIVFHDICQHPAETGVEVKRFWDETKTRYQHEEIIRDKNQGWAGIGVLFA